VQRERVLGLLALSFRHESNARNQLPVATVERLEISNFAASSVLICFPLADQFRSAFLLAFPGELVQKITSQKKKLFKKVQGYFFTDS
jgi:hypothetical protein